MTKLSYPKARLALTAAVLGVLAVLVTPTMSSAAPQPRHDPWQKHTLRVAPGDVLRWESNRQPGPDATLETGVYVDGRELPQREEGCRVSTVSPHIAIIFGACNRPGGAPGPIRATAASLDDRPHRVMVVWRFVR